jgi:mRNA degradation ribonuclease J1/J2
MSEPLRLSVFGGLGEIGMNCMGNESRGEIFIIGMHISALQTASTHIKTDPTS